jgi:cytochrome b6-f complex iron-sulfur subunit
MTTDAALVVVAAANLSQQTVAILVIGVMLGLFLIIMGGSFLRSRRTAGPVSTSGAVATAAEPDATTERPKPAKPLARRDFLRGGLLASVLVFLAQFGGASIAFLWPNLKGGFGSVITAGSVDDIKNSIQAAHQPFYFGAGRFYIVPYDVSPVPEIYASIVQEGLMALYQKCVHLGCRVPFCVQSQWFECPCHGSKYNEAGEYELGPAPTGLNRFKLIVEGGLVKVDTSNPIAGPPRGTDTIHESPQGPFCV